MTIDIKEFEEHSKIIEWLIQQGFKCHEAFAIVSYSNFKSICIPESFVELYQNKKEAENG